MKTVKLISMSEIKTEKERKDGKVSRKFYEATFTDSQNPFIPARSRRFFQDHNFDGTIAIWKSGDPSIVKQYLGKEIPGEILNVKVASYKIENREVDNVTLVLLSGEKLSTVCKQMGHIFNEAEEPKVQPSEALNM